MLFFFMISLLSTIHNRWNRSKIFLSNKNWDKVVDSSNYYRYTEFYKLVGNSAGSRSETSNLNSGVIEVSYDVLLRVINEAITSTISIVPYTVFRVSTGVGENRIETLKLGESTFTNILNSLNILQNKSVVYHKNGKFLWKSRYINILNYSSRKSLFFSKIQLFESPLFKLTDQFYLSSFSKTFYKSSKYFNSFRVQKSISQVSWNFYKNDSYDTINLNIRSSFNTYFIGLKFIWTGIRLWVIGLFVATLSFFFFLQLKGLIFNKTVFGYFIAGMFFYWLISGFVFFIKKYQYSKFTSVIQRFWKRTFIIFWMIEGSLFVCFFYLVLNAPEEPLYMYDQIKIYKTHLFSWRWFLIKLLPSVLLIVLGFYLQMLIRWGLFFRQSPLILLITVLIVYIFWVEFYQFFHVVSYYGNFFWVYDYDEFLWSLELDDRRNRIVNNSVAISLIAKFWHIVFMFIFWVFFVLRINEIGRIRYSLIAANNQNFILLYMISWVYMYPWFKYIFRKQLDISYYWFNLHFRKTGVRVFFIDIKLQLIGLFSRFDVFTPSPETFKLTPLFYWHELDNITALSSYRKSSISNKLINTLNFL